MTNSEHDARKNSPLIDLLPTAIRAELLALDVAREDDAVSAEEWQSRSRALAEKASTLPPALRGAFEQAVKKYAKEERRATVRATIPGARRSRSGNPAARASSDQPST